MIANGIHTYKNHKLYEYEHILYEIPLNIKSRYLPTSNEEP